MTDSDPRLLPLIQWATIQPGREGPRQTLRVMADLVRASLRDDNFRDSVEFAAGSRKYSLDAIDFWVREHFEFRAEMREVVRTPQFMWANWQQRGAFDGDCDDVSTMLGSLLKIFNYPAVRFVAIRYNPDVPDFEHVFVEFYSLGRWRVLDPTVTTGTDYHEIERMV